MKTSWNEIPSLDNLKIDWEYEPENPLGKRSTVRLLQKDLSRMLDEDQVPVKILSKTLTYKGYLVDLSTKGLACLLDVNMKVGLFIKVGFFIGKRKILSRGIIKNICLIKNSYRVGIEFVDLTLEDASFLSCLNSSNIYRS